MAKYKDLIPENIAFADTKRIGVYNSRGERLFGIPLGNLSLPFNRGQKLYSFGALSDVHIGESAEAKANEEFQNALTFFNNNVDFVCISGDLIHSNQSQTTAYKSIVDSYSNISVYACAGNHDGAYISDVENVVSTYTGFPLYYWLSNNETPNETNREYTNTAITTDNDVFIFLGVRSNTAGQLFTTAELQWLYETLETNRNKRCFLFQHVRPDDACGNALNIYTYDIWNGTEKTVFESLLRHYTNVVFFHGHSHLKFDLQQYSGGANIDNGFGCWSVHVPSIAVPRSTSSIVNPTRTELYSESEGYVVDIYENGIHLRGRDFIKGEFLPIASYWLDTTLKTIEPNTYIDSTGTITT